MLIQLEQLLAEIEGEDKHSREAMAELRQQDEKAPARLRQLTQRETDAFVDLARHYLPRLDHETLSDAWQEVRDQIRDVLLLKDDQCRQLRHELQAIHERYEQLSRELDVSRQALEKARLDLLSKSGNAEKALREDPSVSSCLRSIEFVDAEIEQGLERLDELHSDARSKLGDYEESSLFKYLRDRKYGTSQYAARGWERRWDRWVAKLIDYQRAKSSYDHLREAPEQLSKLIDEKRDHYQRLLTELSQKRRSVKKTFGVTEQTRHWRALGQDTARLECEWEQTARTRDQLESQLHHVESIHGNHYHQALAIYERFLIAVDPEVLAVYAGCTESPVDDEICARLRGIQKEIQEEEQASQTRTDRILEIKKYLSGLQELVARLQLHATETPREFLIDAALPFPRLLASMREQRLTPAEVWALLREGMANAIGAAAPQELQSNKTSVQRSNESTFANSQLARPIEAALLAASQPMRRVKRGMRTRSQAFDPWNIALLNADPNDSAEADSASGFRMLAFCRSKSDAFALTSLLDAHGIRCFLHDHAFDPQLPGSAFSAIREIIVMVEPQRFDDSRSIIESLRHQSQLEWTCGDCKHEVDRGYSLCWNCGARRGNHADADNGG